MIWNAVAWRKVEVWPLESFLNWNLIYSSLSFPIEFLIGSFPFFYMCTETRRKEGNGLLSPCLHLSGTLPPVLAARLCPLLQSLSPAVQVTDSRTCLQEFLLGCWCSPLGSIWTGSFLTWTMQNETNIQLHGPFLHSTALPSITSCKLRIPLPTHLQTPFCPICYKSKSLHYSLRFSNLGESPLLRTAVLGKL